MKEKPKIKPELLIASRLQRAITVTIDFAILIILFRIIRYFITIVEIIVNSLIGPQYINLFGLTIIISFAVEFLYYYLYESRIGRTIGKYVTSTKVVSFDGSKPSKRDIFNRTLYRIIPFEWISFIFDSNPVGLHDSLSNTVVIKEPTATERSLDENSIRKEKNDLDPTKELKEILLEDLARLITNEHKPEYPLEDIK